MQSWKTALPPGRQALVWEPDLVCREALWNVSKRQLPQEVEKAVSEPRVCIQLISEAAAFTTHLQGAHHILAGLEWIPASVQFQRQPDRSVLA